MSDTASEAGAAFKSGGLGRKLGPLPIWGWAVIIVGIIALVYYFVTRSGGVASNASAQDTQVGNGLSDTSTDQSLAGSLSTLYGGSGSGYTTTYSNNQEYEQAAIADLSGSTQYTGLQISKALGDLFSGSQLSTDEQAIVNKVYGSLGAPPEYVPTPNLAAPTTTTTNPPTTTTVTKTVPAKVKTYALPTGSNNTLVWIKGLVGKRRGGLYSVTGNKATFLAGQSRPAGVQEVTSESAIKSLQRKVKGLY